MTASEYVQQRQDRGATVRRIGDAWMVTCPAHDDDNPSLQVSVGADDRVLLHCHAGCQTRDVLAADGLDFPDLFATAGSSNGSGEVAAYRYTDEQGRPLFDVVRLEPKDFRQRRPNGGWGIKGVRRVLYRLPEVVSAVQDGQTVYVAEGEKDADALRRAGVVATCNPMGAGKWRRDYGESLRGADVVIVADRDDAGHDHARTVAESLQGMAASVRVVEAVAGKDAADHLAAGKTVTEFAPVDLTASGGDPTQPLDLRDSLASLLRLRTTGIGVHAIRMLGNGPSAGVEIDLSNGEMIVTERFGDLWTAAGLAKFVTQNTGIRASGITKNDAEEANALIRQLADVTREMRTADLGRDHGCDFLSAAPVEDFSRHDQHDRYRAFALLDESDPVAVARRRSPADAISVDEASAIAQASLVLRDRHDGVRFVHCGHLFTYVHARREVSHPMELARQMTLAGWTRRGKRGDMKATSASGLGKPIRLRLWWVPKGWEETDDTEDS